MSADLDPTLGAVLAASVVHARAGLAAVRAEHERQAMWQQMQADVRQRLARIDEGEWWAPAQVVRCLRVFVAPEVRR